MKSRYRKLGEFIRQVDVRNKDLRVSRLLGVSISKSFIESIANTVGTDFSNYKVVHKGQFAYGPVTSRNGEKISVALLEEDECIISSSYIVFEIIDENELLPKYLMLWFSRPEFDRYARFKSHGSVREIMDWEEMCNVELPVPDINKQREIVKSYKIISDRIELKRKINDNLADNALALYKEYFLDYKPYQNDLVLDKKFDFIPFGWTKHTLDELCEKITDGSHYSPVETQESIYPMLSVKDMDTYGFDYSSCKLMDEEDYEKMLASDCVPKIDDILIAKDGSYLKQVFIINEAKEQGILSSIAIFRANKSFIYPDLLLYLLKTPDIQREVKENYVTGSAITRIVLKNFKKLELIVPPLNEQERILPLLKAIRKEIHTNCKEIEVLKQLQSVQLSIISSC